MPDFKPFDVVAVPFPYTDRPVRQRRPALVVAAPALEEGHGLLWVVMITAAENRPWNEDIPIADIGRAGLPIPSVIRPVKIATVDAHHAERLGEVSETVAGAVAKALERQLP